MFEQTGAELMPHAPADDAARREIERQALMKLALLDASSKTIAVVINESCPMAELVCWCGCVFEAGVNAVVPIAPASF